MQKKVPSLRSDAERAPQRKANVECLRPLGEFDVAVPFKFEWEGNHVGCGSVMQGLSLAQVLAARLNNHGARPWRARASQTPSPVPAADAGR